MAVCGSYRTWNVSACEACKASKNCSLYTIVVLALATGARQQELFLLCWPDVNLERGTLTFRHTKNAELRTVPLTGYALDLLRQHSQRCPRDVTVVFLIYDSTKRRRLSDAWAHAVKRAAIQDFRIHDLRHPAASYLAMNGASLLEITEMLGHKTLSMVKRYAHLSESHTRHVVAKMNVPVFGE